MSAAPIDIDPTLDLDEEEDLETAFATLGVTDLAGKGAARRSCPACDLEYDGAACPGCGLKFRPRCMECGSRLAWSARGATACPSCGAPTPRVLFFEPRPDPPAGAPPAA